MTIPSESTTQKLLLDDYPLIILPALATVIGLNEAIVLQQVHYWLTIYQKAEEHLPADRRKHFHDGRWWVYNTKAGWQDNFPFWHESTVGRTLVNLRSAHTPKSAQDRRSQRGPLLHTSNFNIIAYDRTLWYTIDYDEVWKLEQMLRKHQNDTMHDPNLLLSTTPIEPADTPAPGAPLPDPGAPNGPKPQPNDRQTEPNATRCEPNRTPARPNRTTARPNSTTTRPNSATAEPNAATMLPNSLKAEPNAPPAEPPSCQSDPMEKSILAPSSAQNDTMEASRMASPIPETSQKRTARENHKSAVKQVIQPDLKSQLALLMTAASYNANIEPLTFHRQDGILTVTSPPNPLGRAALEWAQFRLGPLIARTANPDPDQLVFQLAQQGTHHSRGGPNPVPQPNRTKEI